jgi:PAS domain S-box-containing protein
MDDDAGQARLVQRTLARAGYTVEIAPDGEAGLTQHAAAPYAVLLIDHQMPGMGGLAVLETLGTWGPMPPTIMVTGQGDEGIAVEAMKRGASDYLVKDVEGRYLALLPAVVARVLQQHRLAEDKRQAEAALQETLATLEERVRVRTADLQRANTRLQAEILERRRAEEALARLSRQQQLILEAAGEGIYGVDRQGRVTFINPAAAHMLGWEGEVLLGQVMHERIHHRHADGTPVSWEGCALHMAFHTGDACQVSADVFWRQDGTSFLVEYTATPIREQGEVIGAVVLFRDITARKRAEQEMQRTDRLALVGQLASGLAHEIGTPLNIIGGNAEFLGMQLRDQGLELPELHAIIEQTERITRLIERLLTFARPKDESMAPVALREPLAQALRLVETRLQRDAITITVDVPAELPLVWGAADQLTQVFLNVLVNAWHAMPSGGSVAIVAERTGSQQVRIAFRDSGAGMDSATLARVFEPFYTTKGNQGTGLGLAICKQIIDRYGGTIRLESVPGRGTTVIIDLLQAAAVS